MVDTAIAYLEKDAVMARLIKKYGRLEEFEETKDLYGDLISSIISQQLSVKASETIINRFKQFFGGRYPDADEVTLVKDQDLRGVGLSFQKIKYIKGIAEASKTKSIDFSGLSTLADEQVITVLTSLKGVGRWTAEMILIFSLARPDVFSVGDMGIRNAVQRLYKIDKSDLSQIEEFSRKFSPYRSFASRYLWKSLENA